MVDISSLAGTKGAIVVFVANGCPTARSYEERLNLLSEKARRHGINMVAVNSNNASLSPPDTVDEMAKRSYRFPYVKDDDASLARKYGAICTPHAFVVDGDGRVVYDGRIDDSRLGDRITSRDLEDAVDDMIAGREVRVRHAEPFGCSIVW